MSTKMGKFIFHNPHHYYWFKKPSSLGIGKKNSQKYTYLFDYHYKIERIVYVYIDKYKNTDPKDGLIQKIKHSLHPAFGFYAWILRNKMNPLRFRLIVDYKKIQQDDKLLIFLYGTFTNENGIISKQRATSNSVLGKISAYKIVHCTHYMYHADVASLNLSKINPDLLIAENNLKVGSKFFQNIYSWYKKDFYLLPFVPNLRFIKNIAFEKRINKAFAMGSIVDPIKSEIFTKYFPHGNLQPMRVAIRENQNKLDDYIYSIISYINEPIENGKSYQQNYFNKNIVDLYNEYKMFVVPEEVSGLPGIGFIEGMRCGSAFIGINDGMYKDIGMIPGKHYITYDGTLDGLIYTIEYYKNNQQKLAVIAENGYKFACEEVSQETVLRLFFNYIGWKS